MAPPQKPKLNAKHKAKHESAPTPQRQRGSATHPQPARPVWGPLAGLLRATAARAGAAAPAAAPAMAASADPMPLLRAAVADVQAQAWGDAEAKVDEALRLAPGLGAALNLKATICAQTRRPAEAERLWRVLLQPGPFETDAATNLGLLLHHAGRHEEALAVLAPAAARHPEQVTLSLNHGLALGAVGQVDEARAAYRRVLALEPGHAQATFNLAKLAQDEHDFTTAHALYREVIARAPRHPGAAANLVFGQHYLADFDPAANAREARALAALWQPPASALRPTPRAPLPPARALRVGLVSADLCAHPVGYFLDGMLRHIDRRRVALVAYANSARRDALTERIATACEAWHVIEHVADAAVAAQIRADGIDVLIDLSGLSAGHRQGVFALQPAPVGLSWLGYFSTTGNPAIDAVLADPVCVPPHEEQLFVERIVRLPTLRYCFTPPAGAPPVASTPAQANGFITFACCQTLPKVNDRVLAAWGRILRGAPTARLAIQSEQLRQAPLRERFIERLQRAGLPPGRVALHGAQPREQYLAGHARFDVMLDTWPYPGGTTTAEALWMGVPTLTLARPGMLGRQGQAMLAAVGLADDWVSHDEDDYVARAIALGRADAAGIATLDALRQGLRARAAASALFDAPRFARDWTDALMALFSAAAGTPART